MQFFWDDVTKSFERVTGRNLATCRRRVGVLEDKWRKKFAARSASGGVPGNNNSDLARGMRAWIDFRDEEERVKKEKDEDVKALDVRRQRLHELEEKRLGLTDICQYETTVVEAEEEIGPQGLRTHARLSINGNHPDAEPPEDGPVAEARDRQNDGDLPIDLEGIIPDKQPKASDQVAAIAELLRKRQGDEREEAEIRREEQVLLNKRLAMMEEQMQMLSKLIKVHVQPEQNQLPAPSARQAAGSTDEGNRIRSVPVTEAAAGATPDIIVIDNVPPAIITHESAESSTEPGAIAGPVSPDGATLSTNEFTGAIADDTMDESEDMGAASGLVTGSDDANGRGRQENRGVRAFNDVSTNENRSQPDSSAAELANYPSISAAATETAAMSTADALVAETADIHSQEADIAVA